MTSDAPRQYRKVFQSSNLQSGVYDPDDRTLTLTFTSGDTYDHFDVPESIWTALCQATSPGQYFHRQIKSAYKSRKV